MNIEHLNLPKQTNRNKKINNNYLYFATDLLKFKASVVALNRQWLVMHIFDLALH